MMDSTLTLDAPERRGADNPGRREADQTLAALREELQRQNERLVRVERKRTCIYLGALAGIGAVGAYNICALLFAF